MILLIFLRWLWRAVAHNWYFVLRLASPYIIQKSIHTNFRRGSARSNLSISSPSKDRPIRVGQLGRESRCDENDGLEGKIA